MQIAIVGGGRLGQTLGRLLITNGQPVVAVSCLDQEHARSAAAYIGAGVAAVSTAGLAPLANHFLVATPDNQIDGAAQELAAAGARGVALHTCGARGVAALAPLHRLGVACGVLHPLQTVPDAPAGLTALRGVAFAIQGEGAALEWAESIVRLLNGTPLRIPSESQAVYHAAAVMASNYVVALLDAAVRLMELAGVREDEARAALRPLVESSVANALSGSPVQALTGPIRRGDSSTVSAHLKVLDEPIASLYRAAGLYTLEVARRAGLGEPAAQSVAARLLDNGQDDG